VISKTEYLFGHPKEEYEPELSNLVKRRLRDARQVLRLIAKEKLNPHSQWEMDALIRRYEKVEEAIRVWTAIAEMEEEN